MGLFLSKYTKFERELPDVTGKVFAITGTTSGTGFVAAETVAKHGGEVLLLNRPSSRSTASLEKLKAAVPDAKFVAIDCDLQDFDSVRKAADEIKSKYTTLYCLSNNAGIMATDDEITKNNGFEKQMQTNHLSHFLLTKELYPLLKKSADDSGDARVVQHSSIARNNAGARNKKGLLEEKYFTKKEKDGTLGGSNYNGGFMVGPQWDRYAQTKLANSVFCQALHDKLTEKDSKVLSVCAHPGIARTNLSDHLVEKGGKLFAIMNLAFGYIVLQSSEDGAMGLLKGMMDARDKVQGGILYGPGGMGITGYPVAIPPEAHESDAKSKDLLWSTSETATGASFSV